MKTFQALLMAIASMVYLVLIAAPSYSIDMQQIQKTPGIKRDLQKSGTLTPQLCYDHDAQLSMTKTISSGNGVFTLRGKVCNIGPGDFVVPPAAETLAVYYVDKRYPPLTYAQTAIGSKDIYSQKIKNLKKGECIDVNTTYTVPGVIQWGTASTTAKVRQAAVMFTLRVENTKNVKDCNWRNDTETLPEILYMEKR